MCCFCIFDKQKEEVVFFWWHTTSNEAHSMMNALMPIIDLEKFDIYVDYEQNQSNYSHAAGYQN